MLRKVTDLRDLLNYAADKYGTGAASVTIYGGRVHRVYGGSNTKGNVRQTAVTMLNDQESCHFVVDEAYGGGKSAPMDAEAQLLMSCIPGLKAAYGGAEAANIDGDVVLNITNGNFDRVFGGNNVSGTINGTITVNIEETGCKPVIIGQLYGGGNQAAYTGPLKSGSTTERQGPVVNARSFTSIGDVFGGGYGVTAKVTGDTEVNINVCEGLYINNEASASESLTGERTISFTQFVRNPTENNPDGFEFEDEEKTVRKTEEVSYKVYLPPHVKGQIGGINNIFGGGNAAEVDGNTNVNIGTDANETIDFATPIGTVGQNANKHEVKGANITGNVYGGGNNAEVTGNTNVTIGKKAN